MDTSADGLRVRTVASITRFYPFYSGCGNHRLLALAEKLSGKVSGDAWMAAVGGRILAPVDDTIGKALFFTGDYDRKVSWIVSRIPVAGDTVIDVGANFGIVTTICAAAVGAAGAVHAIEPNPVVSAYLRRTVAANGMTQVTVREIAAGREPGRLTLSVPRGCTGGGSLSINESDWSDGVDRYEVEVARIDDILDVDAPVALMKVDVEGHERDVFEGGRRKLENGSIRTVLFEEFGAPHGDPLPASLAFFDGLPYDIFGVPRCMVRMRLIPLNVVRANRIRVRDYLAIVRDPGTADMRRRLRID